MKQKENYTGMRAVSRLAGLTVEELERVFGGNQGEAWVPTTGTKGRRQEFARKRLSKPSSQLQATLYITP
jgi:hypothetical protein